MTNKTKNILIVVVIILIIFGSFKIFVRGKENNSNATPEVSLLNNDLSIAPNTQTKEVAVTLTKLKAIKIDKELFSRNSFKELEDFSIKIIPQAVGRSNPFASIEIN